MRSANQLLDFPLVEIATKESPGHSLCQSWIHWCYVLRHQATKRPSFPEEATPRGILTSLPGRVSACWLGWRDGGLLTRSLGVFFNRRHFVTLRAGPSSSPFWKHRCFFGLRFGFRLRKSWRRRNRSCRCFRVVLSVLYKWESEQKQTDTDTHHIEEERGIRRQWHTNTQLFGPWEPVWSSALAREQSLG